MNENKQKELPEVERFVAAKQRLLEFKEDHHQLFEQLYQLVEEYNTSLEAADQAVRATGETHGPFIRDKVITKYNGEKLYDALGHKAFTAHGGIIETVSKYTVDKTVFDAQATAGIIPKDLVDEVRTRTAQYKKIDKLVI